MVTKKIHTNDTQLPHGCRPCGVVLGNCPDRLEYGESSYPAYAKLANLYTIRDRMDRQERTPYEAAYSAAPAAVEESSVVGDYGDSDFLRTVYGKDQADAWAVMDDLMDTLHTVNPRVYEGVMRKIRAL